MSDETKMIIERLSKFNTSQKKPAQTLLDVYPDEMNEIIILLKEMNALLDDAGDLVGNPATNHSASCDIACDAWQIKYRRWKSLNIK